MTDATRLAGFLRASAARPFAWGSCDCCLWAADWARLATGLDPAATWRGRYRTRFGALRLVNRAGGLASLAGAGLLSIGAVPTAEPAAGDIGVVLDRAGPTLAVRAGPGWAVKPATGLSIEPYPVLAAWSLPCRPR